MEAIEASIVVWRLFLKAVTVAKVPLALISTRIVHALDTCSTPRSLRPDLVRHLKSCKNEVSFLLLVFGLRGHSSGSIIEDFEFFFL